MEIQSILEIVKAHKGQNIKASWKKTMKTRKGVEHVVEKETSIVIRGGIEYDNTKAVKEGRESGDLPAENAGLTWGEWAEYPLHITHKGADYARFYPASGVNIATGEEFIPKVQYYLDGKPVEKNQIESFCLASEFKSSEDKPLCFTVKADNVQSIG